MIEVFQEYWGPFVAVLGSVIWLIRLESRSLNNEREIKRLSLQREQDLKNLERSQDQQNGVLTEIRQDIKKLLERH